MRYLQIFLKALLVLIKKFRAKNFNSENVMNCKDKNYFYTGKWQTGEKEIDFFARFVY